MMPRRDSDKGQCAQNPGKAGAGSKCWPGLGSGLECEASRG